MLPLHRLGCEPRRMAAFSVSRLLLLQKQGLRWTGGLMRHMACITRANSMSGAVSRSLRLTWSVCATLQSVSVQCGTGYAHIGVQAPHPLSDQGWPWLVEL